jgi:hypothetical protein
MTTETKPIEPLDSPYFGEEDVMGLQSRLIEHGCIDTDPDYDRNFELMDPVFLAKSLDRLIDSLIAGIVEYPEDMLFGSCDGSHKWEFERAIKAVKASGMTKEELRAII